MFSRKDSHFAQFTGKYNKKYPFLYYSTYEGTEVFRGSQMWKFVEIDAVLKEIPPCIGLRLQLLIICFAGKKMSLRTKEDVLPQFTNLKVNKHSLLFIIQAYFPLESQLQLYHYPSIYLSIYLGWPSPTPPST